MADEVAEFPLFPLELVALPGELVPLHIFEERYKAMTEKAIEGPRRIAMALLKPGWEKNYYGRPAIEPIVCVGRILTHEELPDGKYNFLLQGVARARIVKEHCGKPYRVADLERLPEESILDMHLEEQRERIGEILRRGLGALPGAKQFLQMLTSPMSTATVADLIAFHLLEDPTLKQRLLAEVNVERRVHGVVNALRSLALPAMATAASLGKARFPSNPSLN
jgi:uncharacterized protein